MIECINCNNEITESFVWKKTDYTPHTEYTRGSSRIEYYEVICSKCKYIIIKQVKITDKNKINIKTKLDGEEKWQ